MAMPTASRTTWREARRARIVAAAADLFRGQTYDAVQMDDVARAAEMSKATIYRYFPSKDDLYLAVTGEAMEGLRARLAACADIADPSARLCAMLETLVETFAAHLAPLRLLTSEMAALEMRRKELYRTYRGRIVGHLRETLAEGIARGQFRALDLDAAPSVLIGMVRGGLIGSPDLPPRRLAAAVRAIALRGCGAPSELTTDDRNQNENEPRCAAL